METLTLTDGRAVSKRDYIEEKWRSIVYLGDNRFMVVQGSKIEYYMMNNDGVIEKTANNGKGEREMDMKTGELYLSYEEAAEKLRYEGLTEKQIEKRLMPISLEQYKEYEPMNRHERRKAAKLARKKPRQ